MGILLIGLLMISGLADTWHFSPLLAAMSLGFSTRLFAGAHSEPLFQPLEQLQEVVFVLFFTLAGLHFAPAVVLSHAGLIDATWPAGYEPPLDERLQTLIDDPDD